MDTLTNATPHIGMPARDSRFQVDSAGTTWGVVRCGGPCRDDYARINVYVQDAQHFVKLQQAALDSFQAAEVSVRAQGFGRHIILTGSWRACSTQRALFHDDPNRYADPDVTAHTRGLGIDVNQDQSPEKLAAIHKALTNRGWHQARPDEPWHYSFGLQV